MAQAKTLEEKLIIYVYRQLKATGDFDTVLNCVEVGKGLGLHPNKSKTVIKQMVRGNFFKKLTEDEVCITPHGIKLAQEILGE